MAINKRVILLTTSFILLTTFCSAGDKPIVLMKDQPAPYNGYLFSESQFDSILTLKANYEIDKKLWDAKEKIYQEAIEEAEKRTKPRWWQSPKFNFVLGILVCMASAYVLSQIK